LKGSYTEKESVNLSKSFDSRDVMI
jgi:hypothetical protein